MARNVYRVQYIQQRWVVRHVDRALSEHIVKTAAIAAGQKIAKANLPSQLVIHRMDGTIEDEYTYGNDPFPPRG